MALPEGTTVIVKTAKTYARDLAERVAATFITAAVGIAVAAGPAHWMDLSMWKGAAVAGLIAVGTLIKGLGARYVGLKNSASIARGV